MSTLVGAVNPNQSEEFVTTIFRDFPSTLTESISKRNFQCGYILFSFLYGEGLCTNYGHGLKRNFE